MNLTTRTCVHIMIAHNNCLRTVANEQDGHDCYSRLNIVVRRKPKENNFKAVLETIRDLMNTPMVGRALPQWLREVFLGYGSVSAANYRCGCLCVWLVCACVHICVRMYVVVRKLNSL